MATLHSFLSVGNVDELSPAGIEADMALAEATCAAINRVLTPPRNVNYSRLSDREIEQVSIDTIDYCGLDLIASLDDQTDAQIGAALRAEFERRVNDKIESKRNR